MVLGTKDRGGLWTLVGSFSIIFPFFPSQELQIPIAIPCTSVKRGPSPGPRAQEGWPAYWTSGAALIGLGMNMWLSGPIRVNLQF